MKIEKRGKYPGVKVHLDPEEVEPFLKLAEYAKTAQLSPQYKGEDWFTIALKMAKKLTKVKEEDPDFLKERTPEQIKASMLKDMEKINAQLKAGVEDGSWKHID